MKNGKLSRDREMRQTIWMDQTHSSCLPWNLHKQAWKSEGDEFVEKRILERPMPSYRPKLS